MAISTVAKSGLTTFDKFQRTGAGNTPATGVFVMGGNQASATAYATSADGMTWTARANSGFIASRGLYKIGSAFYCVNNTITAASVLDPTTNSTSPSGSKYGQPDTNANINGLFYANNGWAGWSTYGFMWNGHAWQDGSYYAYTSMAYGNNTWVVVRNSTIQYAAATAEKIPAGLTFTNATSAVTSPHRVFFDNGVFVATGSDGLATSTDGITWTQRNSAGDFRYSRIIFAGGVWFAGIASGSFYTSTNAITWTARQSLGGQYLIGAAYGAGMYVAMNQTGSIWSSPDAVTWTSRTNPLAGTNYLGDVNFQGSSNIVFG